MTTREEVWLKGYCEGYDVPEPKLFSKLSSGLAHDNAMDTADRLLSLFDKRFPDIDWGRCLTCGSEIGNTGSVTTPRGVFCSRNCYKDPT